MSREKKKPVAKAKRAQKSAPVPAQLSRFQSFEMRRIERRSIANFEFNPRQISADAKKTLQRGLNTDKGGVGLIAPITWNETTGRIVSGHQRASCLDALEGSDNYLLDVAVVHLSEAEEVAANVLMNNSKAQGDWDPDLLAQVLKTPDLDLDATGFTPLDLALSFEDPELSALFQPNEATASLVSELAGIKADSAEQKKAAAKPGSGSSSADGDGEHSGESGDDPEPSVSDKARAFRKRGKELFDTMDDTEVMACVVFKSREERENFMERMGLARDERYIDGSRVVARIAGS